MLLLQRRQGHSEGREKVTDVRTDSCEPVRDIGKVEFSGELDTVCVVTAVVRLAGGKGKGVVNPRMVLEDGFRWLFLSIRLPGRKRWCNGECLDGSMAAPRNIQSNRGW